MEDLIDDPNLNMHPAEGFEMHFRVKKIVTSFDFAYTHTYREFGAESETTDTGGDHYEIESVSGGFAEANVESPTGFCCY